MSQMPTGRPECKSASWNDPASVRGHSIRDIAYQHVAPMTPAPMGLNAARRFTPMIGGMVSSTVLTHRDPGDLCPDQDAGRPSPGESG